MANALYDLSSETFRRGLTTVSHVLSKTAAHATERKIEPSAFLDARLSPDMFPLTRQVQIASDTAKRSAARLAGIVAPNYEDTETSFEQLEERVRKTLAFLAGIPADAFAGAAERRIEMKMGGTMIDFSGTEFFVRFALPNFYFHVAAVYNICRHNGVAVGKQDFLGTLTSA